MKPDKNEGPIRLVLADVDGTLVTQEKVLTHNARQVVAQLGQAGDLVCHYQRSAAARHADPDQGPEHLDGGGGF